MAWQLVDQGQISSGQLAPRELAPGQVDRARSGGEAVLVQTDGEHVTVEATRPFPTGATLVAVDPASGVEYRIKVRNGRRVREGWFRIEGRFVSLTKAERAALLAATQPKPEA